MTGKITKYVAIGSPNILKRKNFSCLFQQVKSSFGKRFSYWEFVGSISVGFLEIPFMSKNHVSNSPPHKLYNDGVFVFCGGQCMADIYISISYRNRQLQISVQSINDMIFERMYLLIVGDRAWLPWSMKNQTVSSAILLQCINVLFVVMNSCCHTIYFCCEISNETCDFIQMISLSF